MLCLHYLASSYVVTRRSTIPTATQMETLYHSLPEPVKQTIAGMNTSKKTYYAVKLNEALRQTRHYDNITKLQNLYLEHDSGRFTQNDLHMTILTAYFPDGKPKKVFDITFGSMTLKRRENEYVLFGDWYAALYDEDFDRDVYYERVFGQMMARVSNIETPKYVKKDNHVYVLTQTNEVKLAFPFYEFPSEMKPHISIFRQNVSKRKSIQDLRNEVTGKHFKLIDDVSHVFPLTIEVPVRIVNL